MSEIVSVVHSVGIETEIDGFSLSGGVAPSAKRKVKRQNPLARLRKSNTTLKRVQNHLPGTFPTGIFSKPEWLPEADQAELIQERLDVEIQLLKPLLNYGTFFLHTCDHFCPWPVSEH